MFSFVADLLLHKQFSLEEGKIFLLGQPVCMFPATSFAGVIKELEKTNSQNYLYKSYKDIGVLWTKTMVNDYKMTKGLDVIKWDSDIIALAGQGVVKLISINKDTPELVFRLENSTIAKCYGLSNNPVDHIFRGLVTGAMQVIFKDDTLEGIETSCISMGAQYCEFVIKPRKLFDESNNNIKKQLITE
jgi:predicted hydrocarbon binding protein